MRRQNKDHNTRLLLYSAGTYAVHTHSPHTRPPIIHSIEAPSTYLFTVYGFCVLSERSCLPHEIRAYNESERITTVGFIVVCGKHMLPDRDRHWSRSSFCAPFDVVVVLFTLWWPVLCDSTRQLFVSLQFCFVLSRISFAVTSVASNFDWLTCGEYRQK